MLERPGNTVQEDLPMAIATDETNSDRGLGSDLTLGGDSRYSSHGQARAGSSRLQEFPPPDPEGLVGHHGVIYVVLHVLYRRLSSGLPSRDYTQRSNHSSMSCWARAG